MNISGGHGEEPNAILCQTFPRTGKVFKPSLIPSWKQSASCLKYSDMMINEGGSTELKRVGWTHEKVLIDGKSYLNATSYKAPKTCLGN